MHEIYARRLVKSKICGGRQLENGYTAEFDSCSEATWDRIIRCFQDTNLYQTWAYEAARIGRTQSSHFLLKREDEVAAAAQVRILSLKATGSGIAYVRWGPMWRCHRCDKQVETFRMAIRALRNEYSCRRGMVVRLYPFAYRGQDDDIVQVLEQEGYRLHEDSRVDRTLVMDLSPSIDELRAALHQKWRYELTRAEKTEFQLEYGAKDSFFDEFSRIYWEMVHRKGVKEVTDIDHLIRVQSGLPPELKLNVVLCRQGGVLTAGTVVSSIGSTGIYLMGATSGVGLSTGGSYLAHWETLKWLKNQGICYYDLNGISPQKNPGTFLFKSRLAGKLARDVSFLGRFQVSDSRLSEVIVGTGEHVLRSARRLQKAVRAIRNTFMGR